MVRLARRSKESTTNGVSHGIPTAALHDEVAAALERLSQLLVSHTSRDVLSLESGSAEPTIAAAQETVRFLGQVAAAWADVPEGALPPTGAGFGSTVVVADLDEGTRESFTLMTGAFLDIDGGQVSLASPIGQALLGAEAGDVVSVQTPHRLRRLRVIDVRTLQSRVAGAA